MVGFRKENAGGAGKYPRPAARSWAKVLLSQLMEAHPKANEFRVRLIPMPDKTYDVEVTIDGADGPVRP